MLFMAIQHKAVKQDFEINSKSSLEQNYIRVSKLFQWREILARP